MKFKNSTVLFMLGMAAAGACSKKSSSDDDAAASSGKDLKSLNLAGVLAIDIPKSVRGKGEASSLALSENKSFEACEVRGYIEQMTQMFQQTNSTLCMIKDMGVEPNIKYNIDLSDMMGGEGGASGGPEGEMPEMPLKEEGFTLPTSAQMYIDTSTEGKTKAYLCMDKKLNTMFEFEGSDDKIKGVVYTKGDFGDMAFKSNVSFDRGFTTEGVTTLNVQDQFDTITSVMNLVLNDKTKLNEIAVSKKGSFGELSFADAFFAKINEKFGMVVHYDQASNQARKSFFDGAGNSVAESSSEAFSGALKVEQKHLLKIEDIKADGFPAGAWDCTGTVDLEPKEMSEEAQSSCSQEISFAEGTCSSFTPGADAGAFDPNSFGDIPEIE